MLALFLILAALVFLLFLWIGVEAVYEGHSLRFRLTVGPLKFALPFRKKETGEKKPEPKKSAAPKKTWDEKKAQIKKLYALLQELWPFLRKALQRLRHYLRVDELTIFFVAGAEDPYAAAMQFGAVSAALNSGLALLREAVQIDELGLEMSVDFDLPKPDVYAKISLSLAVWEILYIGLAFVFGVWNLRRQAKRKERTVTNGQPE